MADKEIIKALDYCKDCYANINIDIIDLINRQHTEIEGLNNDLRIWKDIARRETEYVKIAKVEAVKEFAERLKDESFEDKGYYYDIVLVTDIDDVLKEMVGDMNENLD